MAGIADAEVMDCDPELADTADFCAAYGIAMDDSANAIMVIGKPSSAAVPRPTRIFQATIVRTLRSRDLIDGILSRLLASRACS